jgi:hypothetical protein
MIMQVRYQGVDWRDKSNWGCNFEKNPFGPHYLDGGSLEAMEVMFVKVKDRFLKQMWPYPVNAHLYDQWYQASAQVCESLGLATNDAKEEPAEEHTGSAVLTTRLSGKR